MFCCLFPICIPVNLIKSENLGNANSLLMKFNEVCICSSFEALQKYTIPLMLKKIIFMKIMELGIK